MWAVSSSFARWVGWVGENKARKLAARGAVRGLMLGGGGGGAGGAIARHQAVIGMMR
eukprot:SAG22_NODE_3705_length_1565_cov_1.824693_1_plen_57_part_00